MRRYFTLLVVCLLFMGKGISVIAAEEIPAADLEETVPAVEGLTDAEEPTNDAEEIPVAEVLTREEKERLLLDEAFATQTGDILIARHSNVIVDESFLIQPGSFFEVGDPGDQFVRYITILNKTGTDMIYEIQTRDFGADKDSGTPRFYQPSQVGPFPAREWIVPAVTEVALHQGEMATIPVTISIPEKSDAGDHMGAVMVKKKRLTEQSGGVKINAYTSILFIVSVRGDVVTGGTLESLEPHKFLNWSIPIQVTAKARNTGTVHFSPRGTLSFRNIFGIVVDEIDLPSWYVLRESSHLKRIEWRPKYAFGYYTVRSDIAFDVKTGDPIPVQQKESSFVVIPLIPTLIVLLAIFIVSFLVQFCFSRFEIKRKV